MRKRRKKLRIRTGVGVIIRDRLGRVLLEKRSDRGVWGIIGGGIDPGESVVQAAIREAKEETGLRVKIGRFVGIYSQRRNRVLAYPSGDLTHHVDVVFEGKRVSGKLRKSHESVNLRFFSPDLLPRHIFCLSRDPLHDALKRKYGQIR